MPRTVTALASQLPQQKDIPSEIVYLPEGEHHIYPQSHPDGILVKVPAARGTSIAAALQGDLTKLQARTDAPRPRLDFKHDASGPTSGYPTAFRYQPGKGVMCSVDWSGAGRSAIEGRDYAYFSPRVDLDDEGVPMALPDRGPLGALVNEPAFREIERIAAEAANPNQKKTPAMPNQLVACGALSETEAARENAETLAASRVKGWKEDSTKLEASQAEVTRLTAENADLKKKVDEADKEKKDAGKKRADELVEAAVADGRILPKDEETANGFRERIAAGDAFSEKILAGLPTINPDIEKTVIEGGADKPGHDKFKDLSGRELVAAALSEQSKK